MSQELATVLFTDVEGSTDLRTRRGDDAAHRRLQALHDAVIKEIEHHGGRVIKALGDGVLALFRSPRSAVACSVAIQRESASLNRAHPDDVLRVRIGINTGEVLEEDNDVFGESVNAAARIAALAKGGQTLVSAVVRDLSGTLADVTFEDAGSHQLKGFSNEWSLHEVVADESPALTFLDRTPFVGRETELATLERVLDQVMRNRGAVVLVGGEPGVGKTRLAEEVALRAQQRGMLSFTGHCYEMEASVPYAPFVEILEATAETIPADIFRDVMGDSAPELARFAPQIKMMFPDIPPPADLPGEEDRRYTFNSISRYMRRAAGVRPVLLILDDLHWGDESTLQLLEHLALGLHDVPVLVIGTYRDVELAVSRPLSRTMETIVRQRAAQRLSLKRLTEQDVAAMLHRLSGSEPPQALVTAIYSETEGNAFFVEEVFRHLLEEGKLLDATGAWRSGIELDELDVPEGVRLVIGRRLERLKDETRMVLTAAAVMGRVFEFDLLSQIRELTDVDPLDAVDEAERAHLITPTKGRDPRYSFVHELVRQTLLTDISLPRRQRLHLQIAEAIESRHASDLERHTSDLAHHLYQAGAAADPQKTLTYLVSAGDKALRTAASEEALRAYEDALSLADSKLDRAKVLVKIGRARRGLRQWAEARKVLEEALETFEQLGERDLVARTSQMIAERHMYLGEWGKAISVLDRALELPGEHTVFTGGALALQAVAYSWYGRYELARERLEQSASVAEELGNPRLQVGVLIARTVNAYCFGRFQDAIDYGRQAADILRPLGVAWGLATVLGYVHFSLGVTSRWEEAEELYEELWPLASRTGHTGSQLFAHRWHAALGLIRTADLHAFTAAAHRDVDLAIENESPWVADSYLWLGWCELVTGDEQAGLEHMRSGLELANQELANQGMWNYTGWHSGFYMSSVSFLGHRDVVLSYLPQVREALRAEPGQRSLGQISLIAMATEAFAVLGEWSLVTELHQANLDILSRMAWHTGVTMPQSSTMSMTAYAVGEKADAEQYFQQAHAEVGGQNGAYHHATIDLRYALALIDLGEDEEQARGRAMLDSAANRFEAIGMAYWAARARNLREDPSGDPGSPPKAPGSQVMFRAEGEYWTLGDPETPIRLKTSVGLAYLEQLLRNPGQEISALDLVSLAGGNSGDPVAKGLQGDTGPALDPQAKAAYRARLEDLQAELVEAEDWADDERASRARAEIEVLTDELARAVGLGGKDRKTGSVAERARVNVTKALKATISKISKGDPALGEHLSQTVRTGSQCAYLPGKPPPYDWTF